MCSAPVGEGAKRTRMSGSALYWSGTRLQDHVERRLGRAAHAAEAGLLEHLAQLGLARLRAERQAHLLCARARHADLSRRRIEHAPDGIEVVLDVVAGLRLDDHPHAVARERLAHV